MLSSVSTLLLRLMIYRFVVYRNAIGVMNIQFAEGYKNAEKESEPGGRTRKMQSEPGLERGRTFGAGAREKEPEPWGPNSEDGVGAGAREKIDAVRNMSMKRRRD